MDTQSTPVQNPVVEQSQQVSPLPTPPQTVVQQAELPKTTGTSRIAIISLLLVFPPAAYILMWKDKHYHSWFGGILIFTGILSLIMIFIQVFFVIPQLATLYKEFNIKGYDQQSVNVPFMIAGIISVAEIILGWFAREKARKDGQLSKVWIGIPIFLVIFSVAAPMLLLNSIVTPIYALLGQL